MAQYQVPQFIDIEDKIIGPLTLKQFLYLLVVAAMAFIFWTLLEFNYFLIGTVIIGGIGVMFAFVKINGQPFSSFVSNLVNFILKSQKYIWKREEIKTTAREELPLIITPKTIPKTIPESKLRKLAWSLDIKEDNNQ